MIYGQITSASHPSFVGHDGVLIAQGLLQGLVNLSRFKAGVPAQACGFALRCSGTAQDLEIVLLSGQDAQGRSSDVSEGCRAGRAIGKQLLAHLDLPFSTPADWPRNWPLPAELANGRRCLALMTFLASQAYAGGNGLVHQSSLAEPICAIVTLQLDAEGDLSGLQVTTMQSCADPVAWRAITKRIEQADEEDENVAGADVPRH